MLLSEHVVMNVVYFLIILTVSTMDYDPLNTVILNFPSCGTRSCTEVVIIDDDVDEPNENLFVILERTTTLDPRITLRPTEGEILIVDNDSELIQQY